MHYILDNHTPVKVDVTSSEGMLKWGHNLEQNKVVSQTEVKGVLISTVFLGVDHNHTGAGKPVLFETATKKHDRWSIVDRCCTWEEAVSSNMK